MTEEREVSMAKKKQQAHQSALFPESFQWKNVQLVARNDIVVDAGRFVKVQEVKKENDDWILCFLDLESGEKTEQMYRDHDSIYAKIIEDDRKETHASQ